MPRDHILREAARLTEEGQRFALVTIIRTSGSTPRKPGAKMIVLADRQLGTVGGGRIEHELIQEARSALTEWKPRITKRHLTHDLAMCCGGEMEAFIEPMGPAERLLLVGGGHIHFALAPVAARLGFEILLVEELPELATAQRFPDAKAIIDSFDPRDWGVASWEDVYLVVATRDHAIDQELLEALAALGCRPAYLGVIGSRGKLGRFRKRLLAKGVAPDFIERVRGPIGVDVGAETPEEIAVSVAAELIAVRRARLQSERP